MIKLIVAKAGQRVGFDVDSRNGSSLDTYLRLFKSDGTQLASNNDGTAPLETLTKFSYLSYRFATPGDPVWWRREPIGEWLPALSIDDQQFRRILSAMDWLD